MQNERTDVQTSLAQAKAELTTLEANEIKRPVSTE